MQEEPLEDEIPTEPQIDSTHTLLYSLLNVANDATQDDISKAYRNLAITLHPDKHTDPKSRSAAQSQFTRINRAHEVLSDPHKRAVYDVLGEEGLKTSWQVGFKGKTPEQIRAHYEAERLKELRSQVDNLVRHKASASLALDARPLLDPQIRARFPPHARSIYPTNFSSSFNTTANLGSKTTMTYVCSMLSKNNGKGGNFLAILRHQYSPKLHLEATQSALQPRFTNLKATYKPDNDTAISIETRLRSLDPPPLTLTYGQRLFGAINGTLQFYTGHYTILDWGKSNPQATSSGLNLSLGAEKHHISLHAEPGNNSIAFTKQMGKYMGLEVTAECGFNQAGFNMAARVHRKVTEYTAVSCSLILQNVGAISLKLRLARLGQVINIPITLTSSFEPRVFAAVTILPCASYSALYLLYLHPRQQQRIKQKLADLRASKSEELTRQREEALAARTALSETAQRRTNLEMATQGLILVEATYGAAESENEPEASIDVLLPLQALVGQGSSLVIPGGWSKATILGFWDPYMGGRKELRVTYLFRGKKHRVVVGDTMGLAIPLQSHCIE